VTNESLSSTEATTNETLETVPEASRSDTKPFVSDLGHHHQTIRKRNKSQRPEGEVVLNPLLPYTVIKW
jgi:hypothetical protein